MENQYQNSGAFFGSNSSISANFTRKLFAFFVFAAWFEQTLAEHNTTEPPHCNSKHSNEAVFNLTWFLAAVGGSLLLTTAYCFAYLLINKYKCYKQSGEKRPLLPTIKINSKRLTVNGQPYPRGVHKIEIPSPTAVMTEETLEEIKRICKQEATKEFCQIPQLTEQDIQWKMRIKKIESFISSLKNEGIVINTNEFLCPITYEIMYPPLLVGKSEKTYDLETFRAHYNNKKIDPFTNGNIENTCTHINEYVKKQIQEFVEAVEKFKDIYDMQKGDQRTYQKFIAIMPKFFEATTDVKHFNENYSRMMAQAQPSQSPQNNFFNWLFSSPPRNGNQGNSYSDNSYS